MKKMTVFGLAGVFVLSAPVQATPMVFDAFDGFTSGAGNNDSEATWQYLAAKYGWQNSQARHLPDYGYRDYSTATKINNQNHLGLNIPRGELHVWRSLYTYTGSVRYDTGLEWTNHSNLDPDADGDSVTELIEHIHMSPGFTGNGSPFPSSYIIADTLLAFDPQVTEATSFRFDLGVASDYHVSGASDCAATGCGTGEGQRLGLFLNDTIIPADQYWQEDHDPANGSKVANGGTYDDWVLLPDRFARFDDPVGMSFDLVMNPGDIFYLRLNNNGYTWWDGLVLTEAVASASPQTTGGGGSNTPNAVPSPGTLGLMLAALPFAFRSRGRTGSRALPT